MLSEIDPSAEIIQFESIIQGYLDNDFGCCDDFIDSSIVAGLREMLLNHKSAGEMHQAGIGKKFDFQKNAQVRGDLIKWIENDSLNKYEEFYIKKVERFINYLNSTCYTAINDWEFHYATYEIGSFYKRHLDQFKTDKGRKFSLVLYLNDAWQMQDGGVLSIYLTKDIQRDLLPLGGRLVFFKSDEIEHEVHPSLSRERTSIAGWLKNK